MGASNSGGRSGRLGAGRMAAWESRCATLASLPEGLGAPALPKARKQREKRPTAAKIWRVSRNLRPLDDARGMVLAAARPLPPEQVPLESALGRVLAQDVLSSADVPPFDSSAMDGFALASGAGGELRVVAEARAGRPAERGLGPGAAIAVSTGAQVPQGADAVVPIERVDARDGVVHAPEVPSGANVRRAGEDVRAGDVVLRAGAELGPAELGVIASLGLPGVRCGGVPRVAVLVTGDELVEPGRDLGPGQIHDSNLHTLAALATRAGARVTQREHVPDERGATVEALGAALETADVVCVSGGVSVGEHDHVKPALAQLGVDEVFWGVRLKPGKPAWFGTLGERLVFGLPGNPVSAMVVFVLLARPALRALSGADPAATRASAILDAPLRRNAAREQAVRVRLSPREDGWHAAPTGDQRSHVLTSMLGAGALARVPAGDGELAAGDRVEVELLR
jgi:molybdopterin molybdotransferase